MNGYCNHFHGNRHVCVVKETHTDQIVGWGYGYFQFSYFELGTYVHPEHRGHGLGKKIALECIHQCLKKNISRQFYFNTHSKDAERLYFSAFNHYENEYLECDNEEWHLVRIKGWEKETTLIVKCQ